MKIEQWKPIDKQLKLILGKLRQRNKITIDEINDLIPLYSYDDLYKYGDINKLKRYIKSNKQYLKGDALLKANNVLNKTRLLNIDILEMYLIIIYAKQYTDFDTLMKPNMENIVNTAYTEAYKEVVDNKLPPRSQFKTLLDDYLYIYIPALGMSYWEYNISRVLSDASETKKSIILKLQQNEDNTLKKNLQKQLNYYLNFNSKNVFKDIGGYSGSIDRLVSDLVNKATLQGYKDAGVNKVRYIAVIDKVTTGTCKSLDNQVFYVNKENKFYRDDGYGNIKHYKVFGLESGINLPPSVPPVHACRSMIEAVKGE